MALTASSFGTIKPLSLFVCDKHLADNYSHRSFVSTFPSCGLGLLVAGGGNMTPALLDGLT